MRWEERQRNTARNNRGAALMMAVVIIGILMIFVFSLLLVTYSMYASQNKKSASKKNREAAYTLSKAITKDITGDDAAGRSALWRYIRFNICCTDDYWPYYDGVSDGHKEEDACRYFDLKVNYADAYFQFNASDESEEDPRTTLEGFPGSVKLCVYWMPEEELLYDEYGNIQEVTVSQIKESADGEAGIRLFIEVICETASQSCTVKNSYILSSTNSQTSDRRALESYAAIEDGKVNPYNPCGFSCGNTGTQLIDSRKKWEWVETGN